MATPSLLATLALFVVRCDLVVAKGAGPCGHQFMALLWVHPCGVIIPLTDWYHE